MKKCDEEIITTISCDEDEAAFRDAMRDVVPLVKSDTALLDVRSPVEAAPRQNHEDEESSSVDTLSDHISLQIAAGDEWSFLRPGITRMTLRRLRRGYWKIQSHLDLHGFTRDEARLELVKFLDVSGHNGFRCVCVIHGKGLSSKNRQPVLKTRIGNWLAQRNDVLAFCQARPENGGSGAVLVLLRALVKQ